MAVGLPPGITRANHEWIIDFTGARNVWQSPDWPNTKGAGIVIAHPDTGLTHHPELTSNFDRDPALAKNFYHKRKLEKLFRNIEPINLDNASEHVFCHFSHGTSTGSVLASAPGNATNTAPNPTDSFAPKTDNAYVSGIAPDATVISMQVTESVLLDTVSMQSLIDAIYHSIGCQKRIPVVDVAVMSISLGNQPCLMWRKHERALSVALKAAKDHGIVVCCAAGQAVELPLGIVLNPTLPGLSAHTICVAACDENLNVLNTGFYGESVDITAPGIHTWHAKTVRDDPDVHASQRSFEVWNDGKGTSYATAVVAGACALWQARHGRDFLIGHYAGRALLTDAFRLCLTLSATTPTGWDTALHGDGVLDIEALLQLPLPTKAAVENSVPA